MLSLPIIIVGAILAIGAIVTLAYFGLPWLKTNINKRIKEKNAKRVVAGTISRLAEGCPNQMGLDEFMNDDYIASIDAFGNATDVQIIKSKDRDSEIDEYYNLKGDDDMLVINA